MATEYEARHLKADAETPKNAGEVGFTRLCFQCIGELWSFQGFASILLGTLIFLIRQLATILLANKGEVLTTANIGQVMLSWQGMALVALAIAVVALYVAIDLFAHVIFCDGLLRGRQEGVFRRAFISVKEAFIGLARFLTPAGLPTLIFIVFLVPIVGVGFSVGLTRDFYIPSFISEVIYTTPLYMVPFIVLTLALTVIGFINIFTIHGVLLDGLSATEARRKSRSIFRTKKRALAKSALGFIFTFFALTFVMFAFFVFAYGVALLYGESMPRGYRIDAMGMMKGDILPNETDISVMAYRAACMFGMFEARYMIAGGTLLYNSYTVLWSVHLYRQLGVDAPLKRIPKDARYPRRTTKHRRFLQFMSWAGVSLFFALISLVGGIGFDNFLRREAPVAVIAHRLGGNSAIENSLEGLQIAIDQGCYGAETDIQRTSDGHYIINHDDTFRRLAHVDATPQSLTLKEAKQLRLRDARFPGVELPVLTIEEVLDKSQGHIKLFIELKGKTADRQMVDDTVRLVRERDAVDDVTLISLSYDCIEYAETTYPEFETGLLIFGQFGDPALLKCDIILTEEEAATSPFIEAAHESGKTVGIWTINNDASMKKVLNSRADYVITDEMELAKQVQETLDARSDLEFITDMMW